MISHLFLTLVLVNHATSERIVIDTWDELVANPGWTITCGQKNYRQNIADFDCNPIISPAELNEEVGFWASCHGSCLLTYTLTPSDVGFGFRAYFNNSNGAVIKNGVVWEIIPGNTWTGISVSLNFTSTIGIHIPEIRKEAFFILDKIIIDSENATRRVTTTTTTTSVPSTTTTPPLPYFKKLLKRLPLLGSPFC